MKIIENNFGQFDDIDHLNPRFIRGRTKQKVTIDVVSPLRLYEDAYVVLEHECQRLFPSLSKHDCGTNSENPHETKGPFGCFNGAIDVIHIIEHIMIDLLCTITDMKICSGITCHYWDPPNRYDIFVESTNRKMSMFAAYFATSLVREILFTRAFSPKFSVLLEKIKQLQPENPAFVSVLNF